MFKDKMVTPAIPERVYTLCKIVEKKAMTASDLREKMEPDYLQNNTSYFADYRLAAEELGLISISDNLISLAVEPKVVSSYDSMRRYINTKMEEIQDGNFYRVTHIFYEMGGSVLNENKNIANWGPVMTEKLGKSIDAMELRAWRFWVSYLGFGYLHDMFLIPNADVFLQDLILNAGFQKKQRYSFSEFVNKIRPWCNIVISEDPSNRSLNYGVSNGLRTLHDLKVIKLEHILDQVDIWNLYPMKGHPISDTVTNITIL